MILIGLYTQGPPATPFVSKKHSVTPPPTTSVSTTKHVRKVTGASAVADVADALCDVAAQFNLDSGGTSAQATPQR